MITTLEEYKQAMAAAEDWAPGWDAISEQFEKLYPGVNAPHYGTAITSRARLFGGDNYLDGYSLYASPNGYQHIVTYGMTALYSDPEAFGGEWSRWGYEMTMKLVADKPEDCTWALDMLSNLARYTYTQERWFEPNQYVGGDGTSINRDKPDAKLTALLIVPDSEIQGVKSLHGQVDFLQLVGLTTSELEVIMADRSRIPELIAALQADYSYLETDLGRTRNYL